MNKQAALNLANSTTAMFLEHQTCTGYTGAPNEAGKKYADFISALHGELFAYFQKIQD